MRHSRRPRFRALAVVLALIPALIAFPAPSFARADEVPGISSAVPSTPSRARVRMNARVFDTVWDSVRRQYYDPDLHGVDWREARETFRPQAVAALDDRALYRSLSTMLDLLDDEHAGAVSPAAKGKQSDPL